MHSIAVGGLARTRGTYDQLSKWHVEELEGLGLAEKKSDCEEKVKSKRGHFFTAFIQRGECDGGVEGQKRPALVELALMVRSSSTTTAFAVEMSSSELHNPLERDIALPRKAGAGLTSSRSIHCGIAAYGCHLRFKVLARPRLDADRCFIMGQERIPLRPPR